MTIAAVIPTYNAAAFLEGTLASVFAQTRPPDEVIVVDDCSTDDTAAIARRLGATVIVLEKNSGGPAVPLNTGIAAAKSDWIATLDHDDRWRPEWLANAESTARESRTEIVIGRVHLVPENAPGQADLDTRFRNLYTNAVESGPKSRQLLTATAYSELVPALSYGVTCSNMIFARNVATFDRCVRLCCDYRFLQQVTETNDIAVADVVSCDWVNSTHSMYQRGDMDRLDRDLLYVYKRFQPRLLAIEQRLLLMMKCRKTANDLAYAARNRGEYGLAFKDYCDSLRYGGINRTALFGILKLPLAMLRGKRS